MAPDVSMTIPYEADLSRGKENLQSQVQQLVVQKGAFRSVSEASLQLDIEKARVSSSDHENTDSEHGEEVAVESLQATRERLFKARMDGIQDLSAMTNGLSALIDGFASSLAAHSKVAESAISPALKQTVPAGSIESRHVEPRKASKPGARRANDVSMMARAEAFTKAAERMQAASQRLNSQAHRQATYWAELARLRSGGWPVSRLPQNNKTIVVHLGSVESNPEYRSRGIAPLQQDEDGELFLPGASAAQNCKTLVVRVFRNARITGEFAVQKNFSTPSKLETDLMQARESLFLDELFTEASKEARLMANMGVKTQMNSIDAKVSDELSVNISYSVQPATSIEQSHDDDALATFVGEELRLMLITEHQQKYIQRSEQRPQPLSQNLRPLAEYVLLRPVIAQLRHHMSLAPILETLQKYQKSLKRAGLELLIEHDLQGEARVSGRVLADLRRIVTSIIKLQLPSGRSIKLIAETHLAAPRFGTQWNAAKCSSSGCGDTFFPQTSSANTLVRSIEDAFTRDISSMVVGKSHGTATWRMDSKHPVQLVLATSDGSVAALAVTCRFGRLGVSFANMAAKAVEKIEWSESTARVIRNEAPPRKVSETFMERLHAFIADAETQGS